MMWCLCYWELIGLAVACYGSWQRLADQHVDNPIYQFIMENYCHAPSITHDCRFFTFCDSVNLDDHSNKHSNNYLYCNSFFIRSVNLKNTVNTIEHQLVQVLSCKLWIPKNAVGRRQDSDWYYFKPCGWRITQTCKFLLFRHGPTSTETENASDNQSIQDSRGTACTGSQNFWVSPAI